MSQLAHSIEPKTEIIITERCRCREFLLQSDADFAFMLGPSVRYDLPVVLAIHKRPIRDYRPEQVVRLQEKSMPIIRAKVNFL